MAGRRVCVYCAGPLFNAKEREEMATLALQLEEAGFTTFLPQRDGLELTRVVHALAERGVRQDVAGEAVSRAIFALDVYQVLILCDAIVVSLNGRVPDEGAVSEAAIAWCAGKTVIGYKADSRSVFLGRDNPLVTGLFGFDLCGSCEEAVSALQRGLARAAGRDRRAVARNQQVRSYLDLGSRIWSAARDADKMSKITDVLYQEIAERGSGGLLQPVGTAESLAR